MTTTNRPGTTTTTTTTPTGKVFAVLAGLTTLAILLQAVWAGIFLEHDGERDAASSWIEVHARGGEVALALAVITTVYALWKRRARRDLWIAGIVLVVLLVLESYLGGQIVDDSKDNLTAVHIPLGMAIMGLAVWLPVRARVPGKSPA